MRARVHALLLLLTLPLPGCELDVVDKYQSLLMKPELLSMVLEPPEAAPGARVEASYLLADERGVLEPLGRLWVPADLTLVDPAGVGPSSDWVADLRARLSAVGLRWEDLLGERLRLTAQGDAAASAGGISEATLSLLVQVKPLCAGAEGDPATLLEELPANLGCGAVRLGIRRLTVSTRASKAANPRLERIQATDATGRSHPLELARSDDPELAAARQRAAQHALSLEEKSTVVLSVQAKDPTEELEVQWISTGGDFGGTRLKDQRFAVPAYRTGTGDGDRATNDPNLYPVWLILRSSAGGQSWAELYLRVEPSSTNQR